jgi:hypothetical protein
MTDIPFFHNDRNWHLENIQFLDRIQIAILIRLLFAVLFSLVFWDLGQRKVDS